MSAILILHRPNDLLPVYVVKDSIIEWYEDEYAAVTPGHPLSLSPRSMVTGKGTRITLLSGGGRVVHETPDQVLAIYTSPQIQITDAK